MECNRRVFLAWILLAAGTLLAADEAGKRRIEASVRFLADDLLEGRGTPSRGLDIAALYLANELRASGWLPANGNSYLQTYPLRTVSPEKVHWKISVAGVPINSKDFFLVPIGMDPARTPARYDLIFAGYGIYAPERNVDDFAGIDIRGKAVVSLMGAPWPLDPNVVHAYDRVFGKAVHVGARGGSLLIYVSEEAAAAATSSPSAETIVSREYASLPIAFLPEFGGKSTMGACPILWLTPAAFDKSLAKATGGTYEHWKSRLPEGKFSSQPLKAPVEIEGEKTAQEGKASNVFAMLRGSDPALQNEWIVLTAHFDHVGAREVPPGKDGIFNGADDNASGTAAVLETARRLASGKTPKRSVLVVLTSGEDMGLLGSAYYSIHPIVPSDRVVANINVDMVGRSAGTVYAIAAGCDDMFARAAEIGRQRGITVLPDPFPSWRAIYFVDSYHFARLNIPYIDFITEFHKDYHQPTDEADRIRYEDLARIVEAIHGLADFYGQGGPRPSFTRPEWFLTAD